MSSTRPAANARASTPPGNGSDGDHRSLVLGPRDRLVGQLYVEGDLRVIGTVEGGLEVTGSVEIDEGGKVTGPVTARDRLIVGRAGSLKGDVRVARLVVQDGATFSGNVSMGKFVDAPPKPIEAIDSEPAKAPEPVVELKPAKAAEPVPALKPSTAPEPVAPLKPVKVPEPVAALKPAKAPVPVKAQPKTQPPARPQQTKGKRR